MTTGLTGCVGRSHYIMHPGAVNEFDSRTYDALLFVKGILNSWDSSPTQSEALAPAIDVLRRAHAAIEKKRGL
jgi:hypothetical protein